MAALDIEKSIRKRSVLPEGFVDVSVQLEGLFCPAAFLKTPELVRPSEPVSLGERTYQFEDVHFGYKETEILHGISFQTKPGTMTAIVGPSGSGKSTIAKLMAGFWARIFVKSLLSS